MSTYKLDGLVAFSKENVAYTSGYVMPSQLLGVRNRHFAVALNRDGRAAMLLTANELPEAQTRSEVRDLRPYDEFAGDATTVLAAMLKDLGLSDARVGLEFDAVPVSQWRSLKRALPHLRWASGTEAFDEARRVKTARELELLRRAANIAELAQADVHPLVREGMTELEVSRLIISHALLHGAEAVLMAQVAAGDRASFANPRPSARRLARGDLVKIDVFVAVNGYLSDTGRSVVVGEPTFRQREIWANLHETLVRIEDSVRPGVAAADLWAIYAKAFEEYELVPAMRLGHGLGLGLQEKPYVTETDTTLLEPGMVLAIEPVCGAGAGVGLHLEDNLIVTSHGAENMTSRFGPALLQVGEQERTFGPG